MMLENMTHCGICGKVFKTLQGLAGHRKLAHPPSSPLSATFLCKVTVGTSGLQIEDCQPYNEKPGMSESE